MKVLYLKGAAADADASTLQQLAAASTDLDISTVTSSAETLVELRRSPGWEALVVSPSLPPNETLALVASLRRDRIPIAIVPVVDDASQDLFAAAVSSGADDVLVRRGQSLVNVTDTLTRMRQSPHVRAGEPRRRLTALYAGRDALVWNLLEQVPFIKAERVTSGIDGSCPVRAPGAPDGALRCDAVVIDEHPGEAHPLQVLKSIRSQASDLPVIVLTSAGANDIGTAALELGADDIVVKSGIFRRRLIATLRRVHQRLELAAQQADTKTREERLRQIVEQVPSAITVIGADGAVLAMNAEGLRLLGASGPREIVGRDVRSLVVKDHHDQVTDLLHRVTRGDSASLIVEAETLGGARIPIRLRAVLLERDAKGGRGVLATISPALSGADPDEVAAAMAEAAHLRQTADKLEARVRELETGRETELAAWMAEREAHARQLEAAQEEAARAVEHDRALAAEAQSRADDLAGQVETIREELRRTLANVEVERTGWLEERASLDTRVRELEQAREDAGFDQEQRLRLQAELDDVQARWTAERQAWDETRRTLEALAREREGGVASSRAEIEALQGALEQTRQQHAQAVEDLQAQAARERVRLARELDTARDEAAALRKGLEAELADLREAHARLQAVNDRTQGELSSHESHRRQWEADRNELTRLQAETAAAHEADRVRQTTQQALEDELARLRQQQRQLEEMSARVLGERDAAVEALSRERAAHEAVRADLDAARAATVPHDDDRARLEAELARVTRESGERLARLEADHAARLLALEEDHALQVAQIEAARAEAEERRERASDDYAQVVEDRDRLLGSSLLGYALATFEGRVLRCNDTFARMIGYGDPAALVAASAERPFASLAITGGVQERLQSAGRLPRTLTRLETRSGQPLRVHESATLLMQDDGAPLVEHLFVDLGPSPQVDEWRTRRIEELGALASAMTPELETLVDRLHEHGTTLAEAASHAPGRELALTVRKASEELKILVRQLAAFSRRQTASHTATSIAASLDAERDLLRQIVGEFIDFDIRSGTGVSVAATSHDFAQLVTALVTTGRDLLPSGGRLVLESSDTLTGGAGTDTARSATLSIAAAGFGVERPVDTSRLEALAGRCGATLRVDTRAEWSTRIEVLFGAEALRG
jgi:PAS domain S-box-containing protein